MLGVSRCFRSPIWRLRLHFLQSHTCGGCFLRSDGLKRRITRSIPPLPPQLHHMHPVFIPCVFSSRAVGCIPSILRSILIKCRVRYMRYFFLFSFCLGSVKYCRQDDGHVFYRRVQYRTCCVDVFSCLSPSRLVVTLV